MRLASSEVRQANKRGPSGQGTIRSRLLAAFLVMALLPALGIGAGAITVGYYSARQQTLARLESVAARKESEIGAWTQSLQTELLVVLNEPYMLDWAWAVLDLARDFKFYDVTSRAVRNRFQRFLGQSQLFEGLYLLDRQGNAVVSSDPDQEGANLGAQFSLPESLTQPGTRLVLDLSARESVALVALLPVTDDRGRSLGTVAGRASLVPLAETLRESTGVGTTGRTYLVDGDGDLLALAPEPPAGSSEVLIVRELGYRAMDATVGTQAEGSGVVEGVEGDRVVGVHRWLPTLGVTLLVQQHLSEALGAIVTTLGVTLAIVVAGLILAVTVSWLTTRGISQPLEDLVDTATRIAAGDLHRVARIGRDDEIGALARAFNSMTAQLRELINSLEERVRDRTRDLRRRALQLETSAQVSREITSILDIGILLARVTELIRDAFGYYHVLIYLVDRETEELVLRATSGNVGSHHQRLKIGGNSLNGHVAQANQALLANDVAREPRFLCDDLLPNTRSELVIPLRAGEDVIGTLDVHSADVNAFSQQDVLVIQSLGDQIAVAIENARLYERSQALAVLEERNRLARELHDSVTQSLYGLVVFAGAGRKLLETGGVSKAKGHLSRIEEAAQQALKEMRLLVYELRPPALAEEGLVGALRQRLEAVEGRAGVKVDFRVEGVGQLPAPVEEGLFRIAQEALNNALKHASASGVLVRLRLSGGQAELEVRDDGVGFCPDAVRGKGGLGLATMRERAEQLGGEATVYSAPGEGTTVKVDLSPRPGAPAHRQERA